MDLEPDLDRDLRRRPGDLEYDLRLSRDLDLERPSLRLFFTTIDELDVDAMLTSLLEMTGAPRRDW